MLDLTLPERGSAFSFPAGPAFLPRPAIFSLPPHFHPSRRHQRREFLFPCLRRSDTVQSSCTDCTEKPLIENILIIGGNHNETTFIWVLTKITGKQRSHHHTTMVQTTSGLHDSFYTGVRQAHDNIHSRLG